MANTHKRLLAGLTQILGMLWFFLISAAADSREPAQIPGTDPSRPSLIVSCAPDQPVVAQGGSVIVRAWVTDAAGKPLVHAPKYTWQVSAGTASGTDTAEWTVDLSTSDLPRDLFSRETAKVTVRDRLLRQGECRLQVFVRVVIQAAAPPSPDRGARLSGRALLLPTAGEPKGYGLYSYLLFDTPPKDDLARERYLRALESYLLVLQPIAELERYKRRSELNITLIPVKRNLEFPDDLSSPKYASKAAEQVLAAYDYARASAVLANLGKQVVQSGPFLLSVRPMASNSGTLFLFFDMSRVTPELAWDWVRAFCSLAAQERSWSEIELKRLALNTRNAIAVAAKATPEVLGALQQWIQVVKVH